MKEPVGKRSSTEKVRLLIDRRNSKLIAVSSIILALVTSLILVGAKYGEAEVKIEVMAKENERQDQTVKEIRSDIRALEKTNESDHRAIVQSLIKIEGSIESIKEQTE